MAQPGEMYAHTAPSRVPAVQKWLTGIFFGCLGASFVVAIVSSHVAREFGLVVSLLLYGAGFAVAGIGQGVIVLLFPQRMDAKSHRIVGYIGWPWLLGLATIWMGIWATAICLIDAISLANTHQTASDDVFIFGGIIALAPLTVLTAIGWIRSSTERRRARAEAEQARAAWMMTMRTATTVQSGRERTRWRDRWRNRVRRAQHRRTRG